MGPNNSSSLALTKKFLPQKNWGITRKKKLMDDFINSQDPDEDEKQEEEEPEDKEEKECLNKDISKA